MSSNINYLSSRMYPNATNSTSALNPPVSSLMTSDLKENTREDSFQTHDDFWQRACPELKGMWESETLPGTNQEMLEHYRVNSNPTCGVIIIDNFYQNALNVRNFILTQPFTIRGNFPGQRTRSFATEELKKMIGNYVRPFGGEIIDFPLPDGRNDVYNGSFQYAVSRDRSWIHTDPNNNWAAIIFLTPNAPLTSGTAFYEFQDGARNKQEQMLLQNQKEADTFSQDMTKWKLVDQVGNIFNRMVLFDSTRFHMSMDYFGNTLENSRLFQVFFFSTER